MQRLIHVLSWPAGGGEHPIPEGDGDVVFVRDGVNVPPGVLERMAACAAREPAVATLCAFANGGRLAAYPRFGMHSDLSAEGATDREATFARVNAGETVDLPMADVGCVLVTRAALRAFGVPTNLDRFCAAASAAGYRHLLAADAFVRHAHPIPIPDLAPDDAQRDALQEFLDREPVRPLCRRVDLARLRASRKPRLLMVTHRWGGGVQRHVDDLARLAGDDCEVLCLHPDKGGTVRLAWLREGEAFEAWIAIAHWDELLALLRGIGISRMHVHHVHGLPRVVLDVPAELGVPYDVTLHDYYPACMRYHLSPAPGVTCTNDTQPCMRCGDAALHPWGLDVAAWRALFTPWLAAADRVIVPSQDAATRLQAYFPGQRFLVWSHPEVPAGIEPVTMVALLGGISVIKGARLLEACVEDAAQRALPLHFHVVGHVDRPMATLPAAPLTIGGSYSEAMLPRMLGVARPDVFLFLSQVAETYSYTLSAAMATGLPIVATDAGAFRERLAQYPRHALIPPDASAATVNAALLAATRR